MKLDIIMKFFQKIYTNILEIFVNKIKSLYYENKTTVLYYTMIIVGLLLMYSFIYVKFLRSRLPRDIPFQLTIYGLIMIFIICIIYLYSIKTLIKKKKPSQTLVIILTNIKPFFSYITLSLVLLDISIKHKWFPSIYKNFQNKVIPKIIEFGDKEYALLYYCFVIIPGYILLFTLVIDVFYLHRIEIFYLVIFLGILLLLYMYYNYSLNFIKEEYFVYLESLYDHVTVENENPFHIQEKKLNIIPHDKELSIREYFDIQLKQSKIEWSEYTLDDFTKQEPSYKGYPFAKEETYIQYRKKHNKPMGNLTQQDYDIIEQEFYTLEPIILGLMDYTGLQPYVAEAYYNKELRLILYSLYFITWMYILIKSTSIENIINLLNNLKMVTYYIENPFSQTIL